MRVHRMEEGTSCQAILSATSSGRIIDGGAPVASDHVIAGISGVRRVVDPELRVVENVECFSAEFEFALVENLEVLEERKIEIRAAGIVERISSAIPKRQPARGGEGPRI